MWDLLMNLIFQLGIGLHIETKPSGEQIIANVKPGYDAEAKGSRKF
jgi:hypothetical protein